jgi:hypothetical protein
MNVAVKVGERLFAQVGCGAVLAGVGDRLIGLELIVQNETFDKPVFQRALRGRYAGVRVAVGGGGQPRANECLVLSALDGAAGADAIDLHGLAHAVGHAGHFGRDAGRFVEEGNEAFGGAVDFCNVEKSGDSHEENSSKR